VALKAGQVERAGDCFEEDKQLLAFKDIKTKKYQEVVDEQEISPEEPGTDMRDEVSENLEDSQLLGEADVEGNRKFHDKEGKSNWNFAHNQTRLTHDQNRRNICVMCRRKGGRKVKMNKVPETMASHIRRLTALKDFDLGCTSQPSGLCSTCRSKVYALVRVAKVTPGFQPSPPLLGSDRPPLSSILPPRDGVPGDQCDCPICHLASFHPIGKLGPKEDVLTPILKEDGGLLDAEKQQKSRKIYKPLQPVRGGGRPRKEVKPRGKKKTV